MSIQKLFVTACCISLVLVFSLTGYVQAQECDDALPYDTLIILGDSAFEDSDYPAAIDIFTCAIDANPESDIAYLNRGTAHYFLFDYEPALADFSSALERSPDNLTAYVSRGWTYNRLWQPENAIADFEQILSLVDSPSGDTLYGIAEAHYRANNLETSLSYWNDYLASFDSSVAQQRITYIEAQLAVSDDNCDMTQSYGDYAQQALDAFVDQRAQDTLQPAHCAVLLAPDRAQAYSNRGNVYFHIGNYVVALPDLNEALRLDPFDRNAQYARGSIYTHFDEFELAIPDFARIVVERTGFAGDTDALNQLANSFRQMGEYETAFTIYERLVVSMRKENLPDGILGFIAQVEQEVGREVATELTCNGETETGDVRLWGNLYGVDARRAVRDRDYETALENADCGVHWLPYSYDYLTLRARALTGLERYDEALADIDTALFFNPDYSPAYATRGVTQVRLGNVDEAYEALDRALELDPENDIALVARGDLNYEQERFDEALADYSASLETTAALFEDFPAYVQERVDELSG